MVSERTQDRAQLILVGSLLVAIVIIGLALVLNSLVFTQSLDTTGGTADARAAAEFDSSVVRDTRSLLVRVNHGDVYDDTGELDDAVEANYTTYGGLLAETYASQRGVVVDASYDGRETTGTRTIQRKDGAFTDDGTDSGAADWWLVSQGDKRELGWFVVNLNATEMARDPVTVELVGSGGSTREITLQQNVSADSRVDVGTTLDGGSTEQTTCAASRGRVLLDLLDGESVVGRCKFDATDGLTGPYAVRVVHGGRANGTYELVTKNPGTVSTDCSVSGSPAPGPCITPVVWEASVTVVYDSPAVDYRHTEHVTVYNTP